MSQWPDNWPHHYQDPQVGQVWERKETSVYRDTPQLEKIVVRGTTQVSVLFLDSCGAKCEFGHDSFHKNFRRIA